MDEGNRLKNIPLEERTLYDQAFIQVCNLWTRSERVRELAFSKRLARIAGRADGHARRADVARPGALQGAVGRIHAVARRSAVLADGQPELGHGLDSAAAGADRNGPAVLRPRQPSQAHRPRPGDQRRERSSKFARQSRKEKIDEVQEPFALGDVSFHLGWTLHRAGPNTTQSLRRVFTIIYMDADMRLATPKNKNQQLDWETWTPSTQVGEVMDDPLNPVLYEAVET